MGKAFFVNYPCPKCARIGMMSYFQANSQDVHYPYIICGNCQAWFKNGDKYWEEMLEARVERPK